jgi:hypothetical protein
LGILEIDMSTAQEIAMKLEASIPALRAFGERLAEMNNDIINYGIHIAMGREVCARRARKLRKRGHSVVFSGRTKNGKARYRWMKRIPPWAILMPNADVTGLAPEGDKS